jgi:phosphonate transport system permease protein
VEAMTAVGARRWQIIAYGIIPQIIPSFMAFTMYRWDINVRMSTIIGLVGGGGIGRILFYYKNELEWEKVGAVVITIIAVVWTMDYISGRVRERIA